MVYFNNLPEDCRAELVDLTGRTLQIAKTPELKSGISLQLYRSGIYLIRVMLGQENIHSVKIIR
jgi:hypothetical protein